MKTLLLALMACGCEVGSPGVASSPDVLYSCPTVVRCHGDVILGEQDFTIAPWTAGLENLNEFKIGWQSGCLSACPSAWWYDGTNHTDACLIECQPSNDE